MIKKFTLIILFNIISIAVVFAETNKLHPYPFYMNKLISIAKANPKAPFAAMIVDKNTGEVLSVGLNKVHSENNPTLHGEIVAINNCSKEHPNINWNNTVLLTTAEPCPMCESAIVWAGIPIVVYGTSIDYLKSQGWNQIDIDSNSVIKNASFYHGKVIGGVLSKKTDLLFERKIKNIS